MLVALWDPANQYNDNNGSILTNGKVYVYYSGRAALAPTWSSADGSHVNPNPIILDNNGRAVAFADDQYTYTCVVCDFYGRELFSFDPASYGTGGGGSSGEGGPAQHWIGKSASSVSVPKLTATTLPIPENPDYEGDFASVLDNTFVLAPGLYMVDCLVDFRQSSSDLMNKMGSIKFYTSDSSDPIEGQIFERNETGPDASGDSHQVQVSFVRHVAEVDDDDALRFEMTSSSDLTYAKIDRLSIVKLEQGGGGTAYAAGYGIQIDGQVISTSGMMPESSAANFVDVSTYNTDITNIYETIAETSAMIPSGVATEQYVQDFTSAFITEDALDGYATQQWVEDQHYITSADIPPIPQDVITSGELASTSATLESMIPSLDGYATQQWVEDQNFITSADIPPIPQDVVTSGELATVSGEIVNQIPSYTAGDNISIENNVISVDETAGLIAGENINITASGDNYVISSIGGEIPADLVTSGELATVSGEIMSQIPSPTSVSIDPSLSSGTKIAEFNINGTSGELFAPEGGGSSWSEEYVDIPWQIDSTTTTTWQTIADYASAHGGMAPVGFCDVEGQVYYPTLFQPEYKRVVYVSIYKNTYDPSTTWRFSSKTLEQPFSTSYWREFVEGFIGQSDWNESNTSNFSYIQNKPDLSAFATSADLATVSGDIMSQMPSPTTVSIDPTLQTGTKIAEFNINGTSGELFAPAGGSVGSGIESIIPNKGFVISDDGKTLDLQYDNTLSYDQVYRNIPIAGYSGNSKLALLGDPWRYNSSGHIRIYDTSHSPDVVPTWFPVPSDTSIYLRPKNVSWSYTWSDYYIDFPAGRTKVKNSYYSFALPTPKSTGADQDSDKFDIVGDWSSVTTPITTWYIGYTDQNGVLDEGTYFPAIAQATTSVQLYRVLTVKLKSNGGIEKDGYNGLYVKNPLPNSTAANNDQVLTVVSGSPAWVTPSGGGGSEVDIIPSLSSGTKIADYVIDGTSGALYAPAGGGGGSGVFWAEYGVTSYQDVLDAYNSGKAVFATDGGSGVYTLAEDGNGSYPIKFISTVLRGQYIDLYQLALNSDNTWDNIMAVTTRRVPSPTANLGYVLTVNGEDTIAWLPPTSGGSDVDIIPSLQTGTKIADYVIDGTSGELFAPAGGGSVTFPLEVSGSTNVYEARNGLTSGYANAGEIYVGYHDDNGGGEPDIDTVSITPYMVQVKADTGGVTPFITEVTPGVVTLYDNEGGSQYVDFHKVEYWDNTYDVVNASATYWNSAYNAVNASAAYWNSSIFSNQITSAALVNSLPADASAHPNYLYLIPEA